MKIYFKMRTKPCSIFNFFPCRVFWVRHKELVKVSDVTGGLLAYIFMVIVGNIYWLYIILA